MEINDHGDQEQAEVGLSLSLGVVTSVKYPLPAIKDHFKLEEMYTVRLELACPAAHHQERISDEARLEKECHQQLLERKDGSYNLNEYDNGIKRKKLKLGLEQSLSLEESFKQHSTPDQKRALADQLSLKPRQVEVWFQNRRARLKFKQRELDCELLRKQCESLRDENQRLTKELQQLRFRKSFSLCKTSSPLFICASCEKTFAIDDRTIQPVVDDTVK